MPFVEREGARIYWNALGRGDPVVAIMGLGCSSAMWFRVAPRLARHHRVILLDNRGVGQTVTPRALVHRVSTMADDVAAVLDAAQTPRAHVVGFSMGGMIAQQLAVDHPGRVHSLLLIGTHCGGPRVVQAAPAVRRLLFARGRMSAEEGLEAMRPHTYARSTPDALVEEDALVRLANYPTAHGYEAQLHALIAWSVYHDLPRIDVPTLVLHGEEDALIPPQNGQLVAERIKGARLDLFAGASHWLMTDQSERCLAAMDRFFEEHTL